MATDEKEVDFWQVVQLQDVPGAASKAEAARKRLCLPPSDPWPEGIKLEAVLRAKQEGPDA